MRQDEILARMQLVNINASECDGVAGGQRQSVIPRRSGIDDLLQLLLAEAERADVDQILPLMEVADRLISSVEVEHEHVAATQAGERIARCTLDDVVAGRADDLGPAFGQHANMPGRSEA